MHYNIKFYEKDLLMRLLQVVLLLIMALSPLTAQAQNRQNDSNAGAVAGGLIVGGILGALIKGASQANISDSWKKTPESMKYCINLVMESKNITTDDMERQGLAATDSRLKPIINFCQAIIDKTLRTNFSCNVTNDKGSVVQSVCNESYSRSEGPQIFYLSRDDFIRAAAAGANVQISVVETDDGRASRLAAERYAAEEERKRFLESPEGRRQAALVEQEKLRKKREEILRKKAAENFKPF